MERLYKFIKDNLPSTYDISYQTIDENKENTIGIFLYQGQADKKSSSSQCIAEDIKAHIELNCNSANNGIIKALNDLRKFAINIQKAKTNIDGLYIINIKILNKAIPIGRNQHGIQKVVSNIEIMYALEVN